MASETIQRIRERIQALKNWKPDLPPARGARRGTTSKRVPPKSVPRLKRGPGTRLFSFYATLGASGCTDCNSLRRRMNDLGASGCRRHMDELVDAMTRRAETWWRSGKPWVRSREWWGDDQQSWDDLLSRSPPMDEVRAALRRSVTVHIEQAVSAFELGYWRRRKGHEYYRMVVDMVRKYAPQPGTLLDVGGGIQQGCAYLAELPEWDRTSVELPDSEPGCLDGVRLIREDFMTWEPDRAYDVVLCLQVLEHVADPQAFAQKLFACARELVVISIPYKWPAGTTKSHLHDPIDQDKLMSWTERSFVRAQLADPPPHQRLVCVYRLDAP